MTLITLPNAVPCHQHSIWNKPAVGALPLRHGFFTAAGGVSYGLYDSLNCGYGSADGPHLITENRQRAAHGLGFGADRLYGLKQYHSATAVFLTTGQHAGADTRPDADAYVSTSADAAIAILTADCVPVLFADRRQNVIGAAHAGWRGAMGGILESTVNMMCDNGASLSGIEAVIGPAIAKPSYQVGDDCRDAIIANHADAVQFFENDPRAAQKYLFDLPAFVTWQLRRIGLQQITDLAVDTYDTANLLFSHRRATHLGHADCGRQISIIGLAPQIA